MLLQVPVVINPINETPPKFVQFPYNIRLDEVCNIYYLNYKIIECDVKETCSKEGGYISSKKCFIYCVSF